MSWLVVALLSLLWLGFFLPIVLQARRASSQYATATSFQDSLRRLGEVPQPRPRGAPPRARRSARVAARRRDTLAVLAAAVLAGGLLAVGFGGRAVWAVVPPSVALVVYVVILRVKAVRRSARRSGSTIAAPPAAEPIASAPAAGAGAPAPDSPVIVPSVRRRGMLPPSERIAG